MLHRTASAQLAGSFVKSHSNFRACSHYAAAKVPMIARGPKWGDQMIWDDFEMNVGVPPTP
jgi:hypothetical protein